MTALRRFYTKINCTRKLLEIQTQFLENKALSIELGPYQVVYTNSNCLKYLNKGINMEYTCGKILELSYAKTKGFGQVLLSGNKNSHVLHVDGKFFFKADSFLCATSGLKFFEHDNNYEVDGNGSLVISTDEMIELNEDEKLLISLEALVGFDERIKKELVNMLDLKFWNVCGPGRIAINYSCKSDFNKISPGKSNNKEPEVKNYKANQENEENEPSLLTKILDKNDILI